MEVTPTSLQDAPVRLGEKTASFLREALDAHIARFAAQPAETKMAVNAEGRRLGALLSKSEPAWHASFRLPPVVAVGPKRELRPIEPDRLLQHVGSWMDRLRGRGLRSTLRLHLLTLEQGTDRPIATAAKLIRHATAVWIIEHAGQVVGDLEASGPEAGPPPAVQEDDKSNGDGRETGGSNGHDQGPSIVPSDDSATFSVPEWVAFDDDGRLLVETPAQAESYLSLLQESLAALRAAISLAPYMVAESHYQTKRAGLLRELAEQGRALARFQTQAVVGTLQRRTSAGQLNRGLKVSLPYYDDQALALLLRTFDVIPAGRIMFVPALGLRAVQDEQAKVAQDTRLSSATRDHLLEELEMVLQAFRRAAPTESG